MSQVMQAFRTFLGESDMLAYLAMMAPRLMELRRVLKPTGSLYLHCDPTASQLLEDAVGCGVWPGEFQNGNRLEAQQAPIATPSKAAPNTVESMT